MTTYFRLETDGISDDPLRRIAEAQAGDGPRELSGAAVVLLREEKQASTRRT